jgi:hypothetical protein
MAERTAINTVIQGSAADLIKKAMIAIHARLKTLPYPARLLLQIHDELVFETPAEHGAALTEVIRSEMESAMALDGPLVVDFSSGYNCMYPSRPRDAPASGKGAGAGAGKRVNGIECRLRFRPEGAGLESRGQAQRGPGSSGRTTGLQGPKGRNSIADALGGELRPIGP